MANITFNETYTIEEFKKMTDTTNIKLHEGNKLDGTHVRFFTYGSRNHKTGVITTKPLGNKPMVSDCTGEDGRQFFMIHNLGENNSIPSFRTL